METKNVQSAQATDLECQGHYELVRAIFARLHRDIENGWYLESAEAFLKGDLCAYFWDFLGHDPNDRKELIDKVMEKTQSKHPWMWQSYTRVMEQLPQSVAAYLKKLRIEFQFLSTNDFAKRFKETDAMWTEPTRHGAETIGYTIVANESIPEAAMARADKKWEAAIDTSLALELAYIWWDAFVFQG